MKTGLTLLDKTCTKCGEIKSTDRFSKLSNAKEWAKNNPEKRKATYQKRWAKLSPEQKSDQHYRKAYGVTYEQVQEFLKNQDYGCAICETKNPKCGKVAYWHVDHDHKTNCIRGILCFKCNLTIGVAKENVKHMLTACIYLAFHKGKQLGISEWGGFRAGGIPCGKDRENAKK